MFYQFSQNYYNSKNLKSEFQVFMHQQTIQPCIMTYLSTLDKCTQITREDKLRVRNLIKSNDLDALSLFKNLPKNPDMKDLQIKLRKFITKNKERERLEELQKFKENHNLPRFIQIYPSLDNLKPHQNRGISSNLRTPLTESVKQNEQKSQFAVKYKNQKNFHFTNNFVNNNIRNSKLQSSSISQSSESQKKEWINDFKPSSFNRTLNNHSINLKSNSINERAKNQTISFSNMKDSKSCSLIQGISSPKNFTLRSSSSTRSLKQLQNKIQEELKQLQQKNPRKNSDKKPQKSIFQKTQKQFIPNQLKKVNAQKIKQSESVQNLNEETNNKSNEPPSNLANKGTSIVSDKSKNSYSTIIRNIGSFPPIQEKTERDSETQRYLKEAIKFEVSQSNCLSKCEIQQKCQMQQFSNINESSSNSITTKTQQSFEHQFIYEKASEQKDCLFTSPDLLTQCRNFLKKTQQINFQNCGLSNFKVKNESFQSPSKPFLKQQQKDQTKLNFPESIQITDSLMKDFYDSGAKLKAYFDSKESSIQKNGNDRQNQIEYRADVEFDPNKSHQNQIPISQKKITNSNSKNDQFFLSNDSRQNSTKNPKLGIQIKDLSELIELEQLIDTLLELNQGHVQIESSALKHILKRPNTFKAQVISILQTALEPYIKSSFIYNIISIFHQIQSLYTKNSSYKPKEGPAKRIFELLDFQSKGFITKECVLYFISQLENAQIENIADIRSNLLQVFEMADFEDTQKVSYINFYIIRNEDAFQSLFQLIEQFQFEVEDQN